MGLTQINTSYYLGQSYHMGRNISNRMYLATSSAAFCFELFEKIALFSKLSNFYFDLGSPGQTPGQIPGQIPGQDRGAKTRPQG